MTAPSVSAWERFLATMLETSTAEFATYSDSLRGCALYLYLRARPLMPITLCATCSYQDIYMPKPSRLTRMCTECLNVECLLDNRWTGMSLARYTEELRGLCANCVLRVPRTESERLFKRRICHQAHI